jgi:uncharacterized SAM-binding protein YcdF (DUF218 family)
MSFLFLSKLLPLFFYPLGFACLALFVALIVGWKYPRWGYFPVALALIVLLLASNSWVTNYLLKSLEWQNLPLENIPQSEAIVILGGATKSAIAPRPMVDVNEQGDRLLYAAKLYQDGLAPLIIVAGGRIDWRNGGTPEAEDMAELLQLMGVPPSAIIKEPNSLNTYENAVNVKQILTEKGINQVLLVTSASHMTRAKLVFQRQNINIIPAPTDFIISEDNLASLNRNSQAFILSILPEAENIAQTTKALKEYLGMFIYRLKGWI